MTAGKKGFYMRIDGFKKTGTRTVQKKRKLKLLSRLRILFMARKFNTGLFFMLLVVVNMKMCMPDIEKKCILCATGETAEAQGVITKVEVSSYGAKGYNDYDIYYAYTVDGKSYTGRAADSGKGLTYLENHAVVVDYSVKDHGCSCVRDMECLAEKGLFAAAAGGILFLAGLLFMVPGIMLAARACAVLEYGETATGTITGISTERRNSMLNFGGPAAIHRKITLYKAECTFAASQGKNRKTSCYIKSEDSAARGENVRIIYDPDQPGNSIVIWALPGLIHTDPELE